MCECVVWRQQAVRCELWTIAGAGILRVYDDERLVMEEPGQIGGLYDQTERLRSAFAGASEAPRQALAQLPLGVPAF